MTVETGPGWELRLGDYRDVLADVTCDALITDPPYSARTHEGQRTGSTLDDEGSISYAHWSDHDARELAEWSRHRVRWWAAIFSDHVLQRAHEAAWQSLNWYVFAPVGWVRSNPTPRMTGDGPTGAVEWITVARPRHKMPSARMGSRPGSYDVSVSAAALVHPGGKSIDGMRAIVRDYTEPGDLVCDPCAGGGTTLLAAVIEGRRAIGAESDPDTFAKAVARLRRGYTPTFDFGAL